jgi:hypothetical protein
MEIWEVVIVILIAFAIMFALLVRLRRERETLTARLRALTRWHPLSLRREGRPRGRHAKGSTLSDRPKVESSQ